MGADSGCWGPAGNSLIGSACGQGSPCRQWPWHTGSGAAAGRSQAVPTLKGKQRRGGQLRLDQGEGQPFSWLVDQASSSQDTLLLSLGGDWRVGEGRAVGHLPSPLAPPDGQGIMWQLGAMDTVSPSPGSVGPFPPGRQGAALRQALGNHFKGFLPCDSLVVSKMWKNNTIWFILPFLIRMLFLKRDRFQNN